jgi:hypothetical protein
MQTRPRQPGFGQVTVHGGRAKPPGRTLAQLRPPSLKTPSFNLEGLVFMSGNMIAQPRNQYPRLLPFRRRR